MVANKRFHCIYTYFGCQQEVSLYPNIFWFVNKMVSLYLNIFWLSTKGFTVSIHIVAGYQQEVSLSLNILWLPTSGFTVSIHILVVNKRFHCIWHIVAVYHYLHILVGCINNFRCQVSLYLKYCGYFGCQQEVSLYLNILWMSTYCCQQEVSLYLNIFWLSTRGFTVSIHILVVNKRFHCI